MADTRIKLSLTEEAARMLMTRSGWYSSTLHLAIIAMVIITAGWFSLAADQRALTFVAWGGLILGAATIYSGKRLGESFAPQRSAPPAPPAANGEPQ